MLERSFARKKYNPTSKPGERTNPLNQKFINKRFAIPQKKEVPRMKQYTEDVDEEVEDELCEEKESFEYEDMKLDELQSENDELNERLKNYEIELSKMVEETIKLREENIKLAKFKEDFNELDKILTPEELRVMAKVYIIRNSVDVAVTREMLKYYAR